MYLHTQCDGALLGPAGVELNCAKHKFQLLLLQLHAVAQFGSHAGYMLQILCCYNRRNGHKYSQHFQRGAAVSELQPTKLKGAEAQKTGTKVSFLFDKTIFASG